MLEYEARENMSQTRWNNLLAENIQKDNKTRGLKLQIERNLDNLQVLLHDHDSRIFELTKKTFEVVAICGDDQQKEAAFYLTEQLPLVQEERREVVMENEQFHLSNRIIPAHKQRMRYNRMTNIQLFKPFKRGNFMHIMVIETMPRIHHQTQV